ncbi:MAG: hypothetical protein ACE5H9_06525 [Anaerolineae bacterium]
MTKRKQVFNPNSLLTPAGAAAAVWTLTTFLQQVFGLPGKQVAAALSILFGALIAWQTLDRRELMTWISALILGASIYLTAVGGNTIGVTAFTDNTVAAIPEDFIPPAASNLESPSGPGFGLELWR